MRIPFHHASASGWISLVEKNLGFVNSIYSRDRGKGHATGLMENLVAYADEHDILLLLTVQEYGNGPALDNYQLIEFYSKFGFVRETAAPLWPAKMRRVPREKYKPHNET